MLRCHDDSKEGKRLEVAEDRLVETAPSTRLRFLMKDIGVVCQKLKGSLGVWEFGRLGLNLTSST